VCDAGDVVDIGAGIATGGASYAFKKATGSDLPGVSIVKDTVGSLKTPDVPKLDGDLPPPPEPIDPTNQIIQRAMSAARLRNLNGGMGDSFLTGPSGLAGYAPLALPKARGY
jgi:hypothetical protein